MKIGELLIKEGLITDDDLNIALAAQSKTNDRIGDILLKMGFVDSEKLAPILARYFKISYIDLKNIFKDIDAQVIDTVPHEIAQRFSVMPISIKENSLIVAMFDPLDLLAIDTLKLKTGYKIQCVMASQVDIHDAIEYCYKNKPRLEKYVETYIETEGDSISKFDEAELSRMSFDADDQPVIQYVRALIIDAVNCRASDVHIKAKEHSAELKFRIDGVLYVRTPPPKAMLAAINTRIKILSGLDISEQRLPQDGRFKMQIGRAEVDIRTSAFPTIYGESVVMRLLDTSSPLIGLNQLGFLAEDLNKYQRILKNSYGLILVTGPTGSGKTTTLYTSLNEIKSEDKNMMTLEDPVEYRLNFLQQTQVNPHIGFDFARGLRSALRQDPDIIMVGEIRDKETAEIAIHSALTGHLVFSTLHTNDASGAAPRLINMGVEPFLITSSLLGVIGQRLVRVNCPHCQETYTPSEEILETLGIEKKNNKFVRGRGCPECYNSGYKGRRGIYEMMTLNEGLRKLVLERQSSEEIRSYAQKTGMKTLRQVGIEKLKEGLTTPEEILRITQEVDI